MKKELYIIGAGHGADEILEDSIFYFNDCEIKFKNIYLVEDEPKNEKVLPFSAIKDRKNIYAIISAWSCKWKEKLDKLEFNWVSAVSKYADIKLGTLPIGLNARSGCVISNSAQLGRHVRINFRSCVTMDAKVGDYCFIGVGSMLLGYSVLGRASILYSNAAILPTVKVGSSTVIGAGSVVTKDIPDNVIAYGNPCRVIRPANGIEHIFDGHYIDEND